MLDPTDEDENSQTGQNIDGEQEVLTEFSVEYKAQLRANGFTDDQIDALERATFDVSDDDDAGQVSNSNDDKVTVDDVEEAGGSGGIVALAVIISLLLLIPCLIWLII